MIIRILGLTIGTTITSIITGVALASPSSATTPEPPAGAESSEAALLKRAADQCEAGAICLWEERDYEGGHWSWRPTNGYRNLPPYLHDNVGSFYANAAGCFIDWDPAEFRRVAVGDYSKAYDWGGKFGSRIDAINKIGDCHA